MPCGCLKQIKARKRETRTSGRTAGQGKEGEGRGARCRASSFVKIFVCLTLIVEMGLFFFYLFFSVPSARFSCLLASRDGRWIVRNGETEVGSPERRMGLGGAVSCVRALTGEMIGNEEVRIKKKKM